MFIAAPDPTSETQRVYASSAASMGFVMNLTRAQVVADPNATTDADVAALRAVGLSDQEVFEATVFIAFRQAFSTVNDALGVGPDRSLLEQVPP